MSRPQETVLKALRRHLAPGQRVLVAVSGGIDSMTLLHGCCELAKRLKLTIEAAHIDHRLRAGSAADADFVKRQCELLGVPLHVYTAPSKPPRRNAEEWGRSIRYAFFASLLLERALDVVVTAHTANDVAETLLMRLVSNKELRTILRWDEKRKCLRPLLEVTRQEISRYAEAKQMEFVEDPTNRDTDLLRNRVRHVLIPLLEKEFDPRIVEVLAKRGLALGQEAIDLDLALGPACRRLEQSQYGSRAWLKLVREEMRALSDPLRWRLAQALLEPKLGFRISRQKSEDVLAVLSGLTIATELPGGLTLRAKRGGVEIQ